MMINVKKGMEKRPTPIAVWRRWAGLVVLAVAAATAGLMIHPVAAHAATDPAAVPAPQVDDPAPAGTVSENAVFAGGGYWNVQDVFAHVRGVTKAETGYAGGEPETASYELVNMGLTGHAQAVRVTYDPTQVTYGQLLRVFFAVAHDPTQLNRQGPDQGNQFRSAIFPRNESQSRVAKDYIAQLTTAGVFGDKIVTTVTPAAQFYPAEAYQQDYASTHPTNPYILANAAPKVGELQRVFPDLYREDPALTMGRATPAIAVDPGAGPPG